MPVSDVVPAPIWFTAPVPEITPETVTASDRLKAKVALLTMLPVPSVPAVPPSPTCRVPAEIVVVPE